MQKNGKSKYIFVVLTIFIIFTFNMSAFGAGLLRPGMSGSGITVLQNDLKRLGFFNSDATGYYGEITEYAVRNFQYSYGLSVDGLAGNETLSKIEELLYDETLQTGMNGDDVASLQDDLKKLEYMTNNPSGFFGEKTAEAVMKLQKDYGLSPDGIAGKSTLTLIRDLLAVRQNKSSRTDDERNADYMMNWFEGVEEIFQRGTKALIYDIETGLSFMVQRSFGANHADCETLTLEDTNIMNRIYGGEWSWERRAIAVYVDGYVFAASMNGMPHAGLDNYAVGKYVSGRSSGYGYGYNYDAVKGNGISGHFCIHFYKSRLHANNKVDELHQEMVEKANEWLERNH